jgi:D-aminoacyl-tRNA deacylase
VRVVLQRVSRARVTVGSETVGEIGRGLLVLVGVAAGDDASTVERVARKCAELRIFPGADGRFDRSLQEVGGAALVVSQFTLLADARKGRRPSFIDAAPPEIAAPLIESFCDVLRGFEIEVASGRFGAMMQVELTNDGPVTIVIDSDDSRGA